MKRLGTIVATLAMLLGGAGEAAAHAFLERGEPRVGSTVDAPPNRVRLR